MHRDDVVGTEAVHTRKLLRQCLRDREVADIESLARDLDIPRRTLETELLSLTANGELEILRLVGARDRRSEQQTLACAGTPVKYYRLKHKTDGDALWEQDLLRQQRSIDIRLEALLAESGHMPGENSAARTHRGLGVWEMPAPSKFYAAVAEA